MPDLCLLLHPSAEAPVLVLPRVGLSKWRRLELVLVHLFEIGVFHIARGRYPKVLHVVE